VGEVAVLPVPHLRAVLGGLRDDVVVGEERVLPGRRLLPGERAAEPLADGARRQAELVEDLMRVRRVGEGGPHRVAVEVGQVH
jgi:hypothetical protein